MKGKLLGLGIAGLFSMSAVAGSMGNIGVDDEEELRTSTCNKVITLSLGPAWYNNEQTVVRNVFPATVFFPELAHTYVPRDTSGILGSGELYFALARPLDKQVSGQFGLAVAYSGNGKQKGFLNVGRPIIGSYDYSYKQTNARIAFKGKLVSDWVYWARPYISGSAGVGFNRSWDYVTSHRILGIASQPSFSQKTVTAFSYTAGIGLQGNITPEWQIGVGYEFADWGKSSLGKPRFLPPSAPYIPYSVLHGGSFYTHELQFSLSYLM